MRFQMLRSVAVAICTTVVSAVLVTCDCVGDQWTLFSQRIVKGLEILASVYNLFDTDYAHPACTGHAQDLIWQDGRSFRIKATYRF